MTQKGIRFTTIPRYKEGEENEKKKKKRWVTIGEKNEKVGMHLVAKLHVV